MHPFQAKQNYLSPQSVLFENLSAPAERLGVVEEIMLYEYKDVKRAQTFTLEIFTN